MIYYYLSKKLIKDVPYLRQFLCSNKLNYICNIFYFSRNTTKESKVIVWGQKSIISKIAKKIVNLLNLKLVTLEDGFLRSIKFGSEEPPLSILIDDVGIYYDPSKQSKLEELIKEPLYEKQTIRAQNLIDLWKEKKVSKYNHQTSYISLHFPKSFVLVIDQTYGDASIKYGMSTDLTFQAMLDSAIKENPNDIIVLKMHPEVLSGKKKAHFNIKILQNIPNLVLLTEDIHPALLLERAHTVYTVTSQMGFEALIWGKKVRVFGMPFYAGWGLTIDELTSIERRHKINLEQLVYASLVKYPKYINPETLELCKIEDTIRYLSFQKEMRERFGRVCGYKISRRKRKILREFLDGSNLTFSNFKILLPKNSNILVWGKRFDEVNSNNIIRVEDGFLRSVGLGSVLIKPQSLVFDKSGIYFDATKPSDLEMILNNTIFDSEILSRSSHLRNEILKLNITKYNMYNKSWERPVEAKKVILVPGQVENDASIKYGMCRVSTNLELLKSVRAENPDAFIVYKEHPDVVEGIRKNKSHHQELLKYCDEILEEVSISMLYPLVDEVHLMTSLAGFEALLRNKKVVCYGNPFYSGWGLTIDKNPIERRTRKLSLDELVAGALILYPTYISKTTGRYTTPERVILEISELGKNYKPSAFTKIYTWLCKKWNLIK